jgi:hypothetical protein
MSRASLAALLAAIAFAAAAPALAQDGPAAQLFISPMGEPFRAGPSDPYPAAAWFKQADQGNKGYLTRADFQADAARFFKTLDKDDDGYLDDKEVDNYEQNVAPEIVTAMNIDAPQQGRADADAELDSHASRDESNLPARYVHDVSRLNDDHAAHAKPPPPRRGAGFFSFFDEPEPVRAADTNIDFRISLTEWQAAADRRFDALDSKHTGKVMLADLPVTPFQWRYQHHK